MQIPKAAEATRTGLNFVCLGFCWFYDVDHVIATRVLFALKTEDILGDHLSCGASLCFFNCASCVLPDIMENDE